VEVLVGAAGWGLLPRADWGSDLEGLDLPSGGLVEAFFMLVFVFEPGLVESIILPIEGRVCYTGEEEREEEVV
jgi:hypothetical protein